jgi:hypothetical protein
MYAQSSGTSVRRPAGAVDAGVFEEVGVIV